MIDDSELIRRISIQDQHAVELFVARHWEWMIANARKRCDDHAEDCVNEAFFVFCQKACAFEIDTQKRPEPLLSTLVRNIAVSHFRVRKKLGYEQVDIGLDTLSDRSCRSRRENEVLECRKELLREAVLRLSEQEQELFELIYVQELDSNEIADVLQITIEAFYNRRSRLRGKLTEMMVEMDTETETSRKVAPND